MTTEERAAVAQALTAAKIEAEYLAKDIERAIRADMAGRSLIGAANLLRSIQETRREVTA